ncbi:hypothetical protein TYRP_019624 [Tyrophagus putrescentiae]|nr:hypothetical protein TYRP_019624 [Tyrophagus putrescentiae]
MYSDGANTDKKTEKTAASLQCRVPIESRNRLQRVKESQLGSLTTRFACHRICTAVVGFAN